MAKISVQAGSTSVSLPIFIQASTSTAGLGLTGLLGTSAGLIAAYYRGTGTDVPITLTTSSLNAAYTSGLFVEINSTRMGGFYRFDIPDAAIAAGPRSCAVMISGAANMAPLPLEIELTAWNNQDGTAGGMTQLTSTGTLGNISNIRGTATVLLAGAVHTGAIIPIVQTASNLTGTATVILAAGTHAGAIIPIVQTASQVTLAAAVHTGAIIPIVQTASQVTLAAAVHTGAIIPIVQTASNVTNVTNVLGTATVMLAAGVHTGAIVPLVQTASHVTLVDVLGTASDGRIATIADAVATSGVAISTSTMNQIADVMLNRDMSVGADSGGRTMRNAARFLRNKWTISTGTLTVFKEDDTTTAWSAVVASTATADFIVGNDPA